MMKADRIAMRIASRRLTPWIVAALCSGLASTRNAPGPQDERDAMLYAHNVVRGAATPYPFPALAAVSWNATREAVSQAWANGCTFAHSGTAGVGENPSASASPPAP